MNKQQRYQKIIEKQTQKRLSDYMFDKSLWQVIHLQEGDILEQNGHYYDIKRTKYGKLVMCLIVDDCRLEQLKSDKIDYEIENSRDERLNAEVL